jgi:fructose-bisphosphate aldolase, class I
MKDRIREILSWYSSENPGVRTNLARILNHGKLGGTGRILILPVDQGFEIGPVQSFASNPEAYDPRYHFQFAVEAGYSAYAAPRGFLKAGIADYCGDIPLILKCNNHDVLVPGNDYNSSAITSTIEDALRLGCVAVGFTIYTASPTRIAMYEQFSELASQAKSAGLAVVAWAYPFGSGLPLDGWQAVDTTAYSAHIAAQLGADIIKVNLPTSRIELATSQAVYQQQQIPLDDPADRVRHIVQTAFNGQRIVIFAGGSLKNDEQIIANVRAIRSGGGFGSILGRNAFQRRKEDALRLIDQIVSIYTEAAE